MSVRLERFADGYIGATSQGLDAHKMVRQHKNWLALHKPGTATRFRDPLHAVHNVRRLGRFGDDYHAYLIRGESNKHNGLLGLATLMTRQTVIHPQMGEVTGTDVDYWTIPRLSEETHMAIGEALVAESGRLTVRHAGEDTRRPGEEINNRMFAVIVDSDIDSLAGIKDRQDFELYGGPASMRVPDGTESPYTEIAKGGMMSQLYVYSQPIPVTESLIVRN